MKDKLRFNTDKFKRLQRRKEHLESRIGDRIDNSVAYDLSELSALKWALQVIAKHFNQSYTPNE